MKNNTRTIQTIRQMFDARSIAVVGASADPSKYGFMTLDCIIKGGFQGKIYPVNPKGGEILGLRAYTSLMELPRVPDVAVILVPVQAVPQVIRDAGQKGIPGVVITTAGYREVGRDDLQQELIEIAEKNNVRIIGPNIEGFIYMPGKLNAQFFPVIENQGPFATISQSGSLTNGLAEWADQEKLGITATINLGNQVDICESDFMEFLAQDDAVKAMGLYLEGVKNGRRFLQALQRVTPRKPVVILKSGRSSAGEKSVASHTASLAGAHKVFHAACRQYGATPVDNLQDLYDYGKLLSTMEIPQGNRLLILSSSGGIGVIAVDEAETLGIDGPALPQAFVDEVKALNLSPLGSYTNPIDLAAIWAHEFKEVALAADRHDVADVFLINFGDPIEGGGDMIIELKKQINASIAVSYMGGARDEAVDRPRMNQAGVPVFSTPERAVKAIAAAMEYGRFQRKIGTPATMAPSEIYKDTHSRHEPDTNTPADFLLEPRAVALIEKYNIPYPPHYFGSTLDELTTAAHDMGYPVVLKVVSKDVIHKSDSGGVCVNIKNSQELKTEYEAMTSRIKEAHPHAVIEGMLVCRQADRGVELIVGAMEDPVFGPTLMVGMGGIFAEIMKDTAFRVAPLTPAHAREMLMELKGYPLLTGARGSASCDVDAVVDLIMNLSCLIVENPDIKELDLNPVRVYEKGILALDARIMKN
ncbi:acetyltransferase [Desulfocicer vacuolatum DSM 3385]|uniref:Acetyltransferase n=1 Tax=Desulfocicer vacuolatum DSM 3385 TaxID=1121400 RepID=A0A1W2DW80_9BACT|nr:acetate--CoA ligase family protein [Desulfocicer vacuolatum]SMD01815.1 acetyltransferase [Desulfocicer vacuolatum DSM 3385]